MKSFTNLSIVHQTPKFTSNNSSHTMTVKAARQCGHQRLFCVSPTTSEYQYPGQKGFCEVLNSEYHALERDKTGNKSQYIIFFDTNEQIFLKDFAYSSNKRFYNSYADYIPALSLLLIRMTTEAHEQVHEALHDMFVRKFVLMNGLDLQLHMTGQAEKESNGRRKKADQSYRPKPLPSNRSGYWYSVLIESAYSEKGSKLADNARWWLIESAGDVKTH